MAPFYGWGSTASRLEPLRGGSLRQTHKIVKHTQTISKLKWNIGLKWVKVFCCHQLPKY